ncbi:Potassium channel [Thoreauomyces humboldtii]|nr:Potassium channel [Thoreauomyces humboldtii]
MLKFIPLVSGVALPIATFLVTQSLLVLGWFYVDELSDAADVLLSPHQPHLTYYKPESVVLLIAIALGFGILAVACLFSRMLEKKIKWCTRLIIFGAAGQGLFSLASVVTFWAWLVRNSSTLDQGRLTEGAFYAAIAGILSVTVAVLNTYHQHHNRSQVYQYVLYELSLPQRQLVLLQITSISYTFLMGTAYAKLEGWESDDGVYWCISTLATIGFGDLYPRTAVGKAMLPFAATLGIGILAANIYAIRQVALELLTHRLASAYSKSFGIAKEFVRDEIHALERTLLEHQQHRHHHRHRGEETAARSTNRPSTPPPSQLRRSSADGMSPSSVGALGGIKGVGRCSSPKDIPHRCLPKSDDGFRVAASAPDARAVHRPPLPTDGSGIEERAGDGSKFVRHSSPALHDEGVPFRRSMTAVPSSATERTMIISRGSNLPQLTIQTGHRVRRHEVVAATRQTFREQIAFAVFAVVSNMCIFGGLFAYFERWRFFEGLYFCFCALTTIGYGDYLLMTVQSRSVFIWFLYIGIGAFTYLFSLLAERALDQWTVQVSKIESRVDRYERKAKLKKMYRKGDVWLPGRRASKRRGTHDSENVGVNVACDSRSKSPDNRHSMVSSASDCSLSDEATTPSLCVTSERDHLLVADPEELCTSPALMSDNDLEVLPPTESGMFPSDEDNDDDDKPPGDGKDHLETTPLLTGTSVPPSVRFRCPLVPRDVQPPHARTRSVGNERTPSPNLPLTSSSPSPSSRLSSSSIHHHVSSSYGGNVTGGHQTSRSSLGSSLRSAGVAFARHLSIDNSLPQQQQQQQQPSQHREGLVRLHSPSSASSLVDHRHRRTASGGGSLGGGGGGGGGGRSRGFSLGNGSSSSSCVQLSYEPSQRHQQQQQQRQDQSSAPTSVVSEDDDDDEEESDDEDGQVAVVGRAMRMFSGKAHHSRRPSVGQVRRAHGLDVVGQAVPASPPRDGETNV